MVHLNIARKWSVIGPGSDPSATSTTWFQGDPQDNNPSHLDGEVGLTAAGDAFDVTKGKYQAVRDFRTNHASHHCRVSKVRRMLPTSKGGCMVGLGWLIKLKLNIAPWGHAEVWNAWAKYRHQNQNNLLTLILIIWPQPSIHHSPFTIHHSPFTIHHTTRPIYLGVANVMAKRVASSHQLSSLIDMNVARYKTS